MSAAILPNEPTPERLPAPTTGDGEFARYRARLAQITGAALVVSTAEGEDVFEQLAGAVCGLLGVDVAMIAETIPQAPGRMRTLAAHVDGASLRRFEYDVAHSPCRHMAGRESRFVEQGVHGEFAPGTLFHVRGFDAYAARSLVDARGEQIGLVVAMHRRPLRDREVIETLLQIIGMRAAAELERRTAQQAAQTSEQSYRAIFEASEDAIFVHDWDTGAVLDVSPKATDIYGYGRAELLRMRIAEVSLNQPPYTEREASELIQRAKALGTPLRFEWRARHRDGHLMWHEVTLKSALIGGAPRVLAFVRDITARKAADEALQRSEEQYRAIFNASADALVLWDAQYTVVDVNPAFLELYRYRREEIIGLGYPAHMPADFVAGRMHLVRRALAGETSELVTTAIRNDGSRFEVELRVFPIQHRGLPHVLSIARDITERRRAEEQLRVSEARLRATIEAAFDAVVAIDAAGRILEFNAAAERCFGRRRADVLGRPLDELVIPHRHRAAHAEGMARFRLTRDGAYIGRRVETSALRADGTEFPVELTIGVAPSHDGDIFIGYLRDISDRKHAESERAALETQLRQAQKMEAIGQLTGGIAHDFNNILASIMGYVVLASDRPAAAADARIGEHLEQALHSCRRARDLIQQMLTFSRARRGEARAFALADVVRDVAQMLRVTLPATLALDVEALDADCCVVVDPVQAQQAVLNLCINARDALDGNGRIEVRVQRRQLAAATCASCGEHVAGSYVELCVADNGPGIPVAVRERMFDPFFSTKVPGKGTGMGLATVHRVVHEHGGHVLVDSEAGRGTRFGILLPEVNSEAATLPGTALPVAPAPKFRGRVLLVDDEGSVLNFMRELLCNWGLEVSAVNCGPDAHALLQRNPAGFDLLLTDQTMPGMTGVELVEAAHALRADLPVVLYSGNLGEIAAHREKLGLCRTLSKPIEPAELREAVAACLVTRRRR
jgi:PAS domain S-box-containing protein